MSPSLGLCGGRSPAILRAMAKPLCLTLALTLIFSALLGAPAKADSGVTPKEVLFGTCLPFEGTAKETGALLLQGVQIYFDYVNDNGGVHGRKLKLVSFNDGYEPDKAIACFNQLKQAGILAGVMFYGAPPAAKYVPMATAAEIPVIGFGTGPKFIYDPVNHFVFNARASFVDEGADVVDHLVHDMGLKHFGAIFQDDAGGVAILEGIKRGVEKTGASIDAQATYPRNSLDVDAAINQLRTTSLDAVFLLGPFAPAAAVAKRAKELGWKTRFVAVGSRDPFLKAAGASGEGTIVTQVFPPPEKTDLRSVALFHKLLAKYAPGSKATYYGLEAMTNAMLAVEGLKRAGPEPTREKLVEGLESMTGFDAGLGPQFTVKFSKQRHGAFDKAYGTIVRDGRFAVIDDWKTLK